MDQLPIALLENSPRDKRIDLHMYDFGPGHNVAPEDAEDLVTSSSLPTPESATSSVAQSSPSLLNSDADYYEPYLFYTLRNRLIQITPIYKRNPSRKRRAGARYAGDGGSDGCGPFWAAVGNHV